MAALGLGRTPHLPPPPPNIHPEDAKLAFVLAAAARNEAGLCHTHDVAAYINTPRLVDVGCRIWGASATATPIPGPNSQMGTS